MRALFEDLSFETTKAAYFTMRQVGLPLNSSRRDLWFLAERNTGAGATFNLYAYKTQAAAKAAGNDYIASVENVTPVDGTEVELTLTRNGTETPDMTGLKVIMRWVSSPSDVTKTAVYAYVAAPDLVIADNLKAILADYTGGGKALSEPEVPALGVGDPGDVVPSPSIYIEPKEPTPVDAADPTMSFSMKYPFDLVVRIVVLSQAEDAWRACRQFMSQLESIVGDECRTCKGEGLGFVWEGSEGPVVDDTDALCYKGTVRVFHEIHTVYRDDVYPRS